VSVAGRVVVRQGVVDWWFTPRSNAQSILTGCMPLAKWGLKVGHGIREVVGDRVPIDGFLLRDVNPLSRLCVEPPAGWDVHAGRYVISDGFSSFVCGRHAGCAGRSAVAQHAGRGTVGALSREVLVQGVALLHGGTGALCATGRVVYSACGDGVGAAGSGQVSRASRCSRRSSMRVTVDAGGH